MVNSNQCVALQFNIEVDQIIMDEQIFPYANIATDVIIFLVGF